MNPFFNFPQTDNLNFTMKKLLFSLLLALLGGIGLSAQKLETATPLPAEASLPQAGAKAGPSTAINDLEVRKTTEALTAKYSLNADQAKQMYTIQVRKQKNLAQIAAFQNSDPALYRAKVQNVQKGTLASIQRILQTKAQVDLYKKTQSETRMLRNKKQKELSLAKASKEAIETALLAIYAE